MKKEELLESMRNKLESNKRKQWNQIAQVEVEMQIKRKKVKVASIHSSKSDSSFLHKLRLRIALTNAELLQKKIIMKKMTTTMKIMNFSTMKPSMVFGAK